MDFRPPLYNKISVASGDADDSLLDKSRPMESQFPCPFPYLCRNLRCFLHLVKRERRRPGRLVDACCFPQQDLVDERLCLCLTHACSWSNHTDFGSIGAETATETHL